MGLEVRTKGSTTRSVGYSFTQEACDRVDEMAETMNASKSSVVMAIVNNYYEEFFKKGAKS